LLILQLIRRLSYATKEEVDAYEGILKERKEKEEELKVGERILK
jgi:hypothetical protein